MKYLVNVSGAEYEVEVRHDGLRVNGEPVDVQVLSPHLAVINGHNVFYDLIGKRLVNIDNELFDVKLSRVLPIKRPKGAEGEESRTVARANMPGKILRVAVKPGDKVEPQQLLYVLEAMKMENEVLSEAGGTVKEVHKSTGDTVETDEAIITIEAG